MTIGFKVTVENVGGPSFLRHSVVLQSITSMLSTNKFVIVYSLDLSKAFDSVRHSTLFSNSNTVTQYLIKYVTNAHNTIAKQKRNVI